MASLQRIAPLCGVALTLLAPLSARDVAAEADAARAGRDSEQAQTTQVEPRREGATEDSASRWLSEVRAQRRALQAELRARREARRRALDPLGAAQQEAREEAFLKRRRQLRDQIEYDRWLFLNQGPWLAPWPHAPAGVPRPPALQPPEGPGGAGQTATGADEGPPSDTPPEPDRPAAAHQEPAPDWNNRWYYHGW